MVDPITDMLNRIRNARAVSKKTVVIPFSKLKFEISKILEKENFIGKTEKKRRKEKKIIELNLNYEREQEMEPGIIKKDVELKLRRISKPGQRIYSSAKKIKKLKKGCGIAIISTSKGIMTDKKAEKQGLGGEVLFEIW